MNGDGYSYIEYMFAMFNQKGISGCNSRACGTTDWIELENLGFTEPHKESQTRNAKEAKAKHKTPFGEILLDLLAIWDNHRFGKDRLNSIAGALLHEMCHAFLALYICAGEWEGCSTQSCHTLRNDNESRKSQWPR